MEVIKFNTKLNTLENPETFINHFQELQEHIKCKTNTLPVDVFPLPVQEIITATNESLNFPIDFIGASILFAISVSIGNTHRIEVMKGWSENAVLYLSLVGRAGTNKSHPLSFALRPIEEHDNQKFQKYQRERREYDDVVNLTKKEREQQGYSEAVKPVWEQYLVTDFTPEALGEVHKFNKRGVGVYADELASWFKNFNRYNNGSEEQFWLSNWSGKSIRINRKTSDPVFLPMPFISVVGTIQPSVLNELAQNRTENGFIDRLLFVMPDNLKKEYWSENELNPVIVQNWKTIISRLISLSVKENEEYTPQPEILRFSPEAKLLLFEWQRKLTDLSNKPENEAISGIYAKIEMYAIRLSLCLEMIRFACGKSQKQTVGIEAVQGALKLVEYFKKSALKVHSIIYDTDPVNKLPIDKQKLYDSLPESFTTNEGVQIAQKMEIAERTFKRMLANKDLFINNKRGKYEKTL